MRWRSVRFSGLLKRLYRDERGVTLLELTLGMGILALVYLSLNVVFEQFAEQVNAQAVADRMSEVAAGVAGFVDGNMAHLVNSVQSGPAEISIDDLVAAGAINASITTDIAGQTEILNALGQRHRVLVRMQGTGLEVVVTTLGAGLTAVEGGLVASLLGGNGAVISNDGAVCGADGPACISGNGGSVLIDLDDYSGIAAASLPAVGNVAVVMFFGPSQVLSPFLHRNTVPGRPEANRMNTDIDMAGNQIVNSADVRVDSRGRWTSQALFDAFIVGSGDTVAKPDCPPNAPNPRLSASVVSFADPTGLPVSQVILRARNNPAAPDDEWIVEMIVNSQAGPRDPGPALGRIEVKPFCS